MLKKIAFFVSSLNVGGVERAFVNLANSFVADGHQVDFIVCQYIGDLTSELNPTINVVTFGDSRLRKSVLPLYKYIKTNSVDCLITGPTYPNILALLANFLAFNKIKIFVSQHSYQDIEMQNLGIVGKIAPLLIKCTYNVASKVICVSDGVKTDMTMNYNVKSAKAVTVYNAVIDDSFFLKSNECIPSSIATKILNKKYLIAVGRLSQVKNYPFMINAFAQLKKSVADFDYNLVILGEGEEKENIQCLIKELNLEESIFLLAAFSNPLPIIKRAKLFVHTSLSEAMPLVYIEALALKIQIVTVNNRGADEILKNVKQKEIVDSHNQDQFIASILSRLEKNFEDDELPDLSNFYSDKIRNSYLELM